MKLGLRLLLLVTSLALAGCGDGKNPLQPGAQPPAGLDLAGLPAEQRAAVELSQAFLANKGPDWGQPIRVEYQGKGGDWLVGKGEDSYRVIYPTPEDEIKLLSDRTILVNIKTKKVMVMPRR
jgi:hypothetical protein